MTGHDRQTDLGPDSDPVRLLNRALEIARRRVRYRIGATLIIAALLAAMLLLVR